jgi:hypothetical protein
MFRKNIDGPVGLDAEFVFAVPTGSGYCSRLENVPFSSLTQLEISADNGVTWLNPVPSSPSFNPKHIYTYYMQGQGFPLQFRIDDFDPIENYGVLIIHIEIFKTQP